MLLLNLNDISGCVLAFKDPQTSGSGAQLPGARLWRQRQLRRLQERAASEGISLESALERHFGTLTEEAMAAIQRDLKCPEPARDGRAHRERRLPLRPGGAESRRWHGKSSESACDGQGEGRGSRQQVGFQCVGERDSDSCCSAPRQSVGDGNGQGLSWRRGAQRDAAADRRAEIRGAANSRCNSTLLAWERKGATGLADAAAETGKRHADQGQARVHEAVRAATLTRFEQRLLKAKAEEQRDKTQGGRDCLSPAADRAAAAADGGSAPRENSASQRNLQGSMAAEGGQAEAHTAQALAETEMDLNALAALAFKAQRRGDDAARRRLEALVSVRRLKGEGLVAAGEEEVAARGGAGLAAAGALLPPRSLRELRQQRGGEAPPAEAGMPAAENNSARRAKRKLQGNGDFCEG